MAHGVLLLFYSLRQRNIFPFHFRIRESTCAIYFIKRGTTSHHVQNAEKLFTFMMKTFKMHFDNNPQFLFEIFFTTLQKVTAEHALLIV
jgi:hypothetical protein